jgi:hypothetical protein
MKPTREQRIAELERENAELKRLNEVMPCGHLLRYSWPPDGDSGTTRLCLECEIRDCGSVIYSEFESYKSIVDDFGGVWPRYCEKCGAPNIIVRPGDCRCSRCG